jgi:hypothetical protein
MVDLHREVATMPVSEWWGLGIVVAVIIAVGLAGAAWWWVPKWQMRSVTTGDPKARADIEDNFRKATPNNDRFGASPWARWLSLSRLDHWPPGTQTHPEIMGLRRAKWIRIDLPVVRQSGR